GAWPRRSRSCCWRPRLCYAASTIALPAWIGCGDRGDGASRSAPAGVARRDLPGRAHGDHRADVVLEGDLVRVSTAGLLDRLLRAILLEPFLAPGHRPLLRHCLRIDGVD